MRPSVNVRWPLLAAMKIEEFARNGVASSHSDGVRMMPFSIRVNCRFFIYAAKASSTAQGDACSSDFRAKHHVTVSVRQATADMKFCNSGVDRQLIR